jgi:hypothetical protein
MHRKRTTAPDGIRGVKGPPTERPVKAGIRPERWISADKGRELPSSRHAAERRRLRARAGTAAVGRVSRPARRRSCHKGRAAQRPRSARRRVPRLQIVARGGRSSRARSGVDSAVVAEFKRGPLRLPAHRGRDQPLTWKRIHSSTPAPSRSRTTTWSQLSAMIPSPAPRPGDVRGRNPSPLSATTTSRSPSSKSAFT